MTSHFHYKWSQMSQSSVLHSEMFHPKAPSELIESIWGDFKLRHHPLALISEFAGDNVFRYTTSCIPHFAFSDVLSRRQE